MSQNDTVATRIASLLLAIENCKRAGNTEWEGKHRDRIEARMVSAPRGAGLDTGTTLDDTSHPERLCFRTAFHHMDEGGGYDGWTNHGVVVTASLALGLMVRVTGRDRNGIRDYLGDVFHTWLTSTDPVRELDIITRNEAAQASDA